MSSTRQETLFEGRSDNQTERLARVALNRAFEAGTATLHAAVSVAGAATVREQLLAQRATAEQRAVAERIDAVDPEVELDRAHRLGLRFVVPGDDEWPTQLDDLDQVPALQRVGGAPLGLWVRGPMRLDELAQSVAIVGSRSATSYGIEMAQRLAAELAGAGHPVVSGGAFGIDNGAHRGALAGGGRTACVLACGADRVYPAAHRELIDHIGQHGAVIAEVPPGFAPMRMRFLSRNRIIAALARGTVVVEAAVRSGALNTAGWTTSLPRQLMALPGPVTSASSEGSHHLIRSGGCSLVTTAADVLEEIAAIGEHLQSEPRAPESLRDQLTHTQSVVLEAVPSAAAVSVTSIARTARVLPRVADAALAELRSHGLVEEMPTGWRITAAARD